MARKEGNLMKALLVALEAAEAGLDGLPIPVAKGCITGIKMILEQEELRKSNVEAFEKLLNKIQSIVDVVIKPLRQIIPEDMPDNLEKDVQKFANELRTLPSAFDRNRGAVSSKRERIKNRVKDFIRAGDDEELLQDLAKGIEDAIQRFQLSSDVTNQLSTHKTLRLMEADILLRDLPEAPTGGRIEICEEGTRESILLEANDWARSADPGLQQVLWLHGPAGSGKSTVANTLVTSFFKEAILGGRFIFSRAGGIVDAGLLFPTLARQLAQHDWHFKVHLGRSIQSNSKHIGSAQIAEQFEYLILQPLLKLSPSRQKIVIVLDALDECDRRDDVEKILNLLVENIHRLPFLRVFMTSRPEDYIERAAQQQDHKIHDIDINRTSASDDIRLYLRRRLFDRFSTDQQDVDGLSLWPSQTDVETLVERSNNLFIYAATAVRFIMEGADGDPQENLKRLLQDQNARARNVFSSLDHMYSAVIRKALPEDAYPDTVERFQEVIGTIIFNPKPVSVNKLAKLSGSKYNARQIRVALHYLHSIVAVPDDNDTNGIHAYHKSFVDFITDPNRCTVKAALLDEGKTYPELLKRYVGALPEFRNWTPSQSDLEWNFTNVQPPEFRAHLVELECYLDIPDAKYSDSMRREFFLEGIKDQLCSPLPPPPLDIVPKLKRANLSQVPRRITLVPFRQPSDPRRYDLRECDPPLCIGGKSYGQCSIRGTRVQFNSLVMAHTQATIFVDGDGQFFVKDLGTGQGTYLNDVLLSGLKRESAPHPLKHGDILQFGRDTPYGHNEELQSVILTVELQDISESMNLISANSLCDSPPPAYTQSKPGVASISPPHSHPGGFNEQSSYRNDCQTEHHDFPFAWIFICTLLCLLLEHSNGENIFSRFLRTFFMLDSA